MQRHLLLFALTAFFFFAALAAGQVAPGTPNWSAYDGGQYDTINLMNLNVSLNVPGMSKSGSFPFQFVLTGANSYIWVKNGTFQPGTLVPLTGAVDGVVAYNWNFAAAGVLTTGVTCPPAYGSGTATKYSNWNIGLPDGTVHFLPTADVTYNGNTCSNSFTDQTIDGSGYTLSVTGGVVNSIYNRSGAALSYTSSSLTDSNGNAITVAHGSGSTVVYTDTLGFNELTANQATNPTTFTWSDVNSGSPDVALTNTSYTLRSAFACTYTDYNFASQVLTTGITFPDSTSLGLAWEPTPGFSADTTGRLATITLRDGSSTVNFNYNPAGLGSSGHYNFDCIRAVPKSMTRVTTDGTVTYTLVYSVISIPNYKAVNTKVDAGGNKTVYTFTGFTSAGNSSTYAQVLTQVQYYPNTGTVGSPTYGTPWVKIYCYNSSSPTVANCPTNQVTLPITEMDVFTQMSGMSNYARQQTKLDAYGNVTYSAQYDFGGSTPVRATTITIANHTTGNCTTIGATVNNKPCSIVTTENDTGTAFTVQSEKFSYDAYGNMLTHSVSPDGGTTFLVNATSNVYNSNGTISKSYDLANNETDYTYPSSYSDGTCSHFPFPSQVKNVTTGLATNYTWDCTGGVMLTKVDANSNTTTYGYKSSGGTADPFWRLRSVTDPLSNETFLTPTTTTYESSLEFNSSSSIQNLTNTFDGYGRMINVQKQQGVGSSNYDTVTTTYDFTGVNPAIYTSVPCTKTSGGTCGSTTGFTRYVDLMGRIVEKKDSGGGDTVITYAQNDVTVELKPNPSGENTKKVQNESDGLGRPTKSCKVSATASGHVSCGENTGTSSGILTTTTYSAAAGARTVTASRGPSNQQQRKVTVDGLERTTTKVTPEGGTWTYTYDTGHTCPLGYRGAKGQLRSISDPNGNLICYAYDALNRVTGINANGTTCRHFYFDSTYGTVPSGVTTPTYTQGRLAEASTDDCAGNLKTDEWFSYDKNGNVIDQWESTPNSTQYYHSSATFTGPALLTTNLASPSEYTLTYTLDGEGRTNSLKEGTNVVVKASGVTYNAQGQPTEIDLGASTDKDTYTYDANTGRMTNWDFKVNSVDETAILTWNPNWTLNELAITDGFNAGGTQTCDFNPTTVAGTGYDDLGRLVGSSCGTSGAKWNQTDSYDQYDNLTKASSGYVSWNPGYSQTTNHYSCAGCTTDSNGNVTQDNFNLYTWNEFSKLASVNKSGTNCATAGQCLVYDAFGRIVEIDGFTDVEIWYTQIGKTAYMHGTTYSYAYAPAPGGGTMLNQSSTNYYFHKDWLGNARIISTVPATGAGAVTTDQAFAPYGEIYDIFGSVNQNLSMLTGLTQDVLAGMFDTPNRELQAAQQGRWLSPDPAGSGWNQYAYATNPNSFADPSGLIVCPIQLNCLSNGGVFGTNGPYNAYLTGLLEYPSGPDSSSATGTVAADSSSSTPQFCGCADDVTSGVLGSTFAPLPADLFGPAPIDGGTPSAVEIGDLLFQYQGPDPAGLGPAGSTIVANVWQEYVVDVNGNHVQGDFLVNEQVQEMQPNNVTSPTTAGPPWLGGSILDNIGFWNPTGYLYNFVRQTFSVTYPNGTTIPLSTVINQFSIYQNGSLIVGGPSIAIP